MKVKKISPVVANKKENVIKKRVQDFKLLNAKTPISKIDIPLKTKSNG